MAGELRTQRILAARRGRLRWRLWGCRSWEGGGRHELNFVSTTVRLVSAPSKRTLITKINTFVNLISMRYHAVGRHVHSWRPAFLDRNQ